MRAWDNFLNKQDDELGAETVDRWLRSLKVTNFDACNLYLEAEDPFQAVWFEEHLRKKVEASLVNNNNKRIKVHLSVLGKPHWVPPTAKRRKHTEAAPPEAPPFTLPFDELDPFCTFETFIPSESNLLPYKLLCKVTNYDPISRTIIPAEKELASFNPIYLFGGEGTGKTHLLTATAHALQSRGLRVVYVRAETFTEHVVSAIRNGEMTRFREAYRNIDILIIDDIHILSRKTATQEELFHTFNALHLSGKQIILGAECSPQELQHIEPRLISRFEWGIVLALEPLPSGEVHKILKHKAAALDCALHPKVEGFLLETFTNSPKTLTHALESLLLRHHLKLKQDNKPPAPITVQVAKYLLKDLIENEHNRALSPEKIIGAISEYFGIPQEDIFGKAQSREAVAPRQLAMYFCRKKLHHSYTKIGDYFDRDHSTVMSSVKRIENSIEGNDKDLVGAYGWVLKKISR